LAVGVFIDMPAAGMWVRVVKTGGRQKAGGGSDFETLDFGLWTLDVGNLFSFVFAPPRGMGVRMKIRSIYTPRVILAKAVQTWKVKEASI
jgi:hypothetical protein